MTDKQQRPIALWLLSATAAVVCSGADKERGKRGDDVFDAGGGDVLCESVD